MTHTHDRFRLRRRMAVAAFSAILATLAAVLILVGIGDEHMGDKLLQAGVLLGPIIGCLTAIIWKYCGDVTRTDLEEMRNVRGENAVGGGG